MHVIKRSGKVEDVSFDKIYRRINRLKMEPYELTHANSHTITQHVIQELHSGVSTSQIDTQSSIICANLDIVHYEYGILAGRIAVSNHQKNTLTSFKDKMYRCKDLLNPLFYKFVETYQSRIESYIDYTRDYLLDFFGFKTMEKSYLLKIYGTEIVERPQDTFMRMAVFLHMGEQKEWEDNIDTIFNNIYETYDLISTKRFTHASPTLFNCGLLKPQLSSCFLLGLDDSLESIFKGATDCAKISKWSGGVGIHIHDIRASGSLIRGTGGLSSGIRPLVQTFERIAQYINQGGRRPGSFAFYLSADHPDIMDFVKLCRKHIKEELRANKIFLSVWLSDLFMKRVESDGMWSTFCPDMCPGLSDVYGEEYEQLYLKYESEGKCVRSYKAREIMQEICTSQRESGIPYVSYKDAFNRSNNHNNLGIIKSSNLCMEIALYSDSQEYAVCNLASICLPQFVEDTYTNEELKLPESDRRALDHEFPIHPVFNYKKLEKMVEVCTRNLNKVIDINYYPVPETQRSNMRNRPIGIGVQGLTNVFFKFGITFDSPEAKKLNRYIFETIYYAAVSTSTKMARELYMQYRGECLDKGSVTIGDQTYTEVKNVPTTIGSYPSYFENGGCHMANGKFHWELCGLSTSDLATSFDWETLREHIRRFGMRNSHLIALMPTASTSQIMGNGNAEAFEPLTSNVYTRKTMAGEFLTVNKYLIRDLEKLGLWNERMSNALKYYDGSIQQIQGIPDHIKYKYRTVWEMSQKHVIDLAADRQPFVDQSQSMNLFMENPSFSKLTSMHLYSWKKGLKTGMYYLRSKAASMAYKATVDTNMINHPEISAPEEDCLVCGS